MDIKEKVVKCKNQFYEYVTEPKRVKICTITGMINLILFLVIAVLIAHFLDPATPPNGYNMVIHYISDLGSVRYTPVPVLLNVLWMSEAILFTPLVFYLYKKTMIVYKEKEKRPIDKIVMQFLIKLGFISMIIGLIGWFWVGFFSEDEGRLLEQFGIVILGQDFHMFFSLVVFMGFVFAGMFIGSFLIFYPKTMIDRVGVKIPWILVVILGLEMLIWPMFHGVGFLLSWFPSQPFHEWFMMIALFVWLYPIAGITLKMLKDDLAER